MDGCATGTEVHYRRRLSPHGMLRHRDGDVHFRSGVPPTQCCPSRTVGFTSGGELGPPSECCSTGTEGLHPVGSSTHAGGFHRTDVLRYQNVEVQHYAAGPPVSPPDLQFGEASVAASLQTCFDPQPHQGTQVDVRGDVAASLPPPPLLGER